MAAPNPGRRRPGKTRPALQFRMRPEDDDEPQDWWFASTAIPLLAATIGPLANVMSIAALITSWRVEYEDGYEGQDEHTVGFPDPRWCIALNAASLVCGFVGNIFLLFNFTRRIRYIVALPMTIILWYIATGILMAILISMNKYVPPVRPEQTYSQGFWHAVMAAVLYLISSMMLMVNMWGYFLGHYPQHFELTDEQRNLILQTMMFFIWLAGGAGIFAKVSGWQYVDALYFCDVTILTVGFGDLHPLNDIGRGLVFPYSVIGIIILGLIVGSIRQFARDLGHDKIVKTHVEKRRVQTIQRSITSSKGAEEHGSETKFSNVNRGAMISTSLELKNRPLSFEVGKAADHRHQHGRVRRSRTMLALKRVASRNTKSLILREERDRFNAMRHIQRRTKIFKEYFALTMSIAAFGLLWCVGAVGFWKAEAKSQGLTYFEALYFCYVSLLTIGYGDLSPRSNAGKPFFILWSLIAVPTMTILITDMGNTVIASFKRGTFTLADWTVLPKAGVWRTFLEKHPWLLQWLEKKADEAEKRAVEAEGNKRIAEGFRTGPADEDPTAPPPTLDELLEIETEPETESPDALGRRLALAIRRTANDLRGTTGGASSSPRRYSYEEWVEFTRLIRFTRLSTLELEAEEMEEGLVEWDWIGANSPMLADESESEWVLNRLCESLDRYMVRYLARGHGRGHEDGGHGDGGKLGGGHGHERELGRVNERELANGSGDGSASGNEHRTTKKRKTG